MPQIQFISDDEIQLGDDRFYRSEARPYYSGVYFNAARTGASGSYVYTIANGTEVRAFSYAVGGDMGPAGRTGRTATDADTNLEDERRTNNGELVLVEGVGVEAMAYTDPELLRSASRDLTIAIERGGGKTRDLLGHLTQWPAGGGLAGLQESRIGHQPLGGGRPLVGQMQLGAPVVGNMRKLPVAIPWTPNGRGASSFAIKLRAERAIAVSPTQLDVVAAAGVHIYDMPADGAVFLDLMVRLDCAVFSPIAA